MMQLPIVRGEYRLNYNLSHFSWFKTGGNAEVFFKPADLEDLQFFLQNIDRKIPLYVLGNFSNVIIRDAGVKGVVIKLGRNFANIVSEEGVLKVGAATLNSSLVQYSLVNSYGGFEFLAGIPGCVGGGIRMNAGCYGHEFKDIILEVKAIDFMGNIQHFKMSEDLFGYRECFLPKNLIFIEGIFKTGSKPSAEIKSKIEEITNLRLKSQPIKELTSGSTFANPLPYKAWEMIDSVGLRGFTIGGAKFSELHCNFLINTGTATSKDLEDLGELAVKKVLEEKNIQLRWEIQRIGELCV
ncbi:MAG: UDP-N-acetylmuramate dehydrogenase [Rickettsiaceae bacterium]|nr:UDP-N-acetylmuramate dehydrogenase [Rickettsiaceae bacterium]